MRQIVLLILIQNGGVGGEEIIANFEKLSCIVLRCAFVTMCQVIEIN